MITRALRDLLAQSLDAHVNGDHGAVGHGVTEASTAGWVGGAEEDFTRDGVDAIASQQDIGLGGSAVIEMQDDLAALLVVDVVEKLLAKNGRSLGQQVCHTFQKLRANAAPETEIVRWCAEKKRFGLVLGILFCLGVVTVPVGVACAGVFLLADVCKELDESRIDLLHPYSRGAGECESGADLMPGLCSLVNDCVDAAASQTNGGHHADNATAHDGDVKGTRRTIAIDIFACHGKDLNAFVVVDASLADVKRSARTRLCVHRTILEKNA